MYGNIREEELKNRVAQEYFDGFDCAKIVGDIDFCVGSPVLSPQNPLFEQGSLLWAEAKKGRADLYRSLAQLVLTVGKARAFDKHLPPAFLGAFDAEKIAFVPYSQIQAIFYQNDFNWNVAPSNHETKEFKQILAAVQEAVDAGYLQYDFRHDGAELRAFIRENFVAGGGVSKTRIDKNNFLSVYNKWLPAVKPTIAVNWDVAQKHNIIDADFYLADLLSRDNETLKEKLYVVLQKDRYQLDRNLAETGLFSSQSASFRDKQKAHAQFWNRYERPPLEEYWDYIIKRRDLLVPQDIRERKGSFFTPAIWVELSQKYIADALGADWQDEYYIWDCAAGTGNLLAGLTDKYRVWASTLDRQDVDVMHDRIKNGANLLEDHVFRFDFLNDGFEKLPKNLQAVIADPEKRKKLIVYINPPYAEATSAGTVRGTNDNKSGVAKDSKANTYYKAKIGNASNEMYALFMARIYEKIPCANLMLFSTLKFIQGNNFVKFRNFFLAKYLGGFVVRADTFDNVTGKFPIGFTMWEMDQESKIKTVECDVLDIKGNKTDDKLFYGDLSISINKWIKKFDDKKGNILGFMSNPAPDFQNNNFLAITNNVGTRHVNYFAFNAGNIIEGTVYFAVRHVIPATWLNDRDQFLSPSDSWADDIEFQNDCLAYTMFHGQNRVTASAGPNHWIPFAERETGARAKYVSDFMPRFLAGKIAGGETGALFEKGRQTPQKPLVFSPEARAVFAAGKALWAYYHAQPGSNPDAALYDIREHFQGRAGNGKMNHKSGDDEYAALIAALRLQLKNLAKKIAPKVYGHGFLKG